MEHGGVIQPAIGLAHVGKKVADEKQAHVFSEQESAVRGQSSVRVAREHEGECDGGQEEEAVIEKRDAEISAVGDLCGEDGADGGGDAADIVGKTCARRAEERGKKWREQHGEQPEYATPKSHGWQPEMAEGSERVLGAERAAHRDDEAAEHKNQRG